ncbi:MAG: hypothetical protein ACXVA9_05380 [Bdellovibrionales bacterium]
MEAAIKSSSPFGAQTRAGERTLLSGVATGQVAGLIMAVVVMIVFTILGKSPLFPVQVIGSTLFGEPALHGFHFGALIAGLLLHQLGPSLLWGVIFGLIAGKFPVQSTSRALGLGLAMGVISMAGPYILIPAVMNVMQGVDYWNREVPMFWDWAAHIVFGASFVLYPKIHQAISRR